MIDRDSDEDDVRQRPGRRSRPRTRRRPAHTDAVEATVVGVDRGRFRCVAGDRQLIAMRSGSLRRTSIVVGDRVEVVGDGGRDDADLVRIVRLAPRSSVLRRTADDEDPVERVIVANADQLVVVVALADPEPHLRFVDRCLVAAYDASVAPLLCLTKRDLASPDTLLAQYAHLGVEAVATGRGLPYDGYASETRDDGYASETRDDGYASETRDDGIGALLDRLRDRTSVLIGQSGVGKSTLVNRLVPTADRATGPLTAAGQGRHISSSVVALPLAGGGWIVDTPGVRSFGLGAVTPQTLLRAFPELTELAEHCPPGCAHHAGTECALDALTADAGAVVAARLLSYRRLLEAKEAPE